MKIKLKRQNNAVHFEAENESGNIVQIDGSPAIGGEGKGARPMELMIMGLGGCSSIDVISILQKQKQEIKDFEVVIHAERAQELVPSLFTEATIEFIITGNVDKQKAERAVSLSLEKYCSVSKTLEAAGAKITGKTTVINE